MNKRQSMHYKECSPMQTVEKLKNILSEMGIETYEDWSPVSKINTYSVRITFKGTNIGSNGKGVTKEYALASGYAEFFERYQNKLLNSNYKINNNLIKFVNTADEKIMSATEIVSSDNAFIKYFFKLRNMSDCSIEEKVNKFNELYKLLSLNFKEAKPGDESYYTVIPFYNVNKDSLDYLPYVCYMPHYGSNGMCAGNSPEEALVQGLSELIERYVKKKILYENLSLPDIPESYVSKYPYIYEMYKILKNLDGYNFMLKDCSLGGKYPVVALIIIEKNTGRYGINIGCHPEFGIAMERTFTEATQGQDIYQYCKQNKLNIGKNNISLSTNIFNINVNGQGEYPYQMFIDKPDFEYTPIKDVSDLDNKTILLNWVKDIMGENFEILIRDVSVLGFPSYHIIIPGMSEVGEMDDLRIRAYMTRNQISPIMNNLENINPEHCKYIVGVMNYYINDLLYNELCKYSNIFNYTHVPFSEVGHDCLYFIAMCYAMMGEYDKASKKLSYILDAAKSKKIKDISLYKGMKYYFDLMNIYKDHKFAIKYLSTFFDDDVINRLNIIFENNKNILKTQYTFIDSKENFYNNERSPYEIVMEKLMLKELNSTIDQKNLSKLFSN